MFEPQPAEAKSGAAAEPAKLRLTSWVSELLERGPDDPFTRLVLLVLSAYMSHRGDSCFPSVRQIASDAAISRRAAFNHLKRAIGAGWIMRRRAEPGTSRRRSNEYFASIPPADGAPGAPLESSEVIHMGAAGAPLMVQQVHPEGAAGAPIEQHTNIPLNYPVSERASRAHRTRKVPLPESWGPSERVWRWAREKNISELDVKTCLEAFVDYARANDRRFADWDAAFLGWLRREKRLAIKTAAAPTTQRAPRDTTCCWTAGGREPRCGEPGTVHYGGGRFLCGLHAGEHSKLNERRPAAERSI